jgi:hypothetical protein
MRYFTRNNLFLVEAFEWRSGSAFDKSELLQVRDWAFFALDFNFFYKLNFTALVIAGGFLCFKIPLLCTDGLEFLYQELSVLFENRTRSV